MAVVVVVGGIRKYNQLSPQLGLVEAWAEFGNIFMLKHIKIDNGRTISYGSHSITLYFCFNFMLKTDQLTNLLILSIHNQVFHKDG